MKSRSDGFILKAREKIIKNPVSSVKIIAFYLIAIAMISGERKVYLFLCLIIQGILGLGCGVMTVTNLSCKENNRANFMAIGFVILGLLKVVRLYMNGTTKTLGAITGIGMSMHIITSLLEIFYIYYGSMKVNEKTPIKRWCIGNLIIFIVGLTIVYRLNPLCFLEEVQLIAINTLFDRSLIWLMVGVFILYQMHKKKLDRFTKAYFNGIMGLEIIKYVLARLGYAYNYKALDIMAYMVDISVYSSVFEFIYNYTVQFIWYKRDEQLVEGQKQLKDDTSEKKLFAFVSHLLKEKVEQIYERGFKLYNRLEEIGHEGQLKYVDKIMNNCRRLMKLNRNIIDLNRLERGYTKPVFKLIDIVELIELLVESTAPYTEARGIEIKIIKSQEKVLCHVSPEAIERVMLNLISNAIKYNSDHGDIEIFINVRNHTVYICVKDRGIGIPKDKLDKIFNRFERLDNTFARTQEGSGLGLTIVRSIIKMHNGEVNIFSEEKRGTNVCIKLPISYELKENSGVACKNKQRRLQNEIQVEFSDLK